MLRMLCPKCRHEQPESAECERCGLIFKRYRDPRPSDTLEPAPARMGWFRTLRTVSLSLSLLAATLVLWPERALLSEPDPEAPGRMAGKLAQLRETIERGEPHELHLDEWEVNSWLDDNLVRAMAATQARMEQEWSTQGLLQGLTVSFVEDRVRIHLRFEVLSKDMSLLLWGRLRSVEGYLRLEVDSGKMGQLPLPGSVLQQAMSNVFEAPENVEKFRLPQGVGAIRVENSELLVDYEAPSSGERF